MKKAVSLLVAGAMLAGLAGCGAAPVATDTDASAPVQEAPVEEQTPATQTPAEEDSAAQTPAEDPAEDQTAGEEAVSLADLPRDDDVTTLQDSAAALTSISEAFSTSLDNGDFGSMEDVSTFFQTQASASLPNSTVEMDETHLTISFRLDGIDYGTAVAASGPEVPDVFDAWQAMTSSISSFVIDVNGDLRSTGAQNFDVMLVLQNADDPNVPLARYSSQNSDMYYDALYNLSTTPAGVPETSYVYDSAAMEAIRNWSSETNTYVDSDYLLPMRCGDSLVVTGYAVGLADLLVNPTEETLTQYNSIQDLMTQICNAVMEQTDATSVSAIYRDALNSSIEFFTIENGTLTYDVVG